MLCEWLCQDEKPWKGRFLPLLIGLINQQKIAGQPKQKENEAKYGQIFVQIIVFQAEMIKHIVAGRKGRINVQQRAGRVLQTVEGRLMWCKIVAIIFEHRGGRRCGRIEGARCGGEHVLFL